MSKFVILDRDGVINRVTRGQYITSPEMIELLPGAADAVARLNAAGYSIVVVSNQQCVALGLLTSEGLDLVSNRCARCCVPKKHTSKRFSIART